STNRSAGPPMRNVVYGARITPARTRSGPRARRRAAAGSGIQQFDAADVAAPFEGGLQPEADDLQGGFQGDHALADREGVGVVVLAGEAGRLFVPAEGAADALETVGRHRLAISRAAEDDRALALAAHHRLGRRADEE